MIPYVMLDGTMKVKFNLNHAYIRFVSCKQIGDSKPKTLTKEVRLPDLVRLVDSGFDNWE